MSGKVLRMSGKPLVLNLAVPRAGLLQQDEPGKLALERGSWNHLIHYAGKVGSLPAEFSGGSAATSEALDKVRSAARDIGSPKQLRGWLIEDPNLLAQKQPPASAYAGMAWLAQRLHWGAEAMVGFLKSLEDGAGQMGSEDRKSILLEMGGTAEDARSGLGRLASALQSSKAGILSANRGLSAAFNADAKVLREAHETVGGLQAKIESVRKKIDDLGWLSSKSHKKELEEQLRSLEREIKDKSAQAEKLRVAVSQLGPILDEGAWLESGMDDCLEYVDKVDQVWTAVGSGLAQLAADAASTQLGDPAWMKTALGLEAAIEAWKAIDSAAKQYTVEALVDRTGA
jgi:hypothetical protein